MTEGLRKISDSMNEALSRELSAFSDHINYLLEEYEDLTEGYLPLGAVNMLEKLRDGVVLAYLLHHLYPESIDLSEIVRGIRIPDSIESLSSRVPPLSPNSATQQKAIFLVTQNLNSVLEAAKTCKLVVVNIGSGDILSMNRDLVLGLVWQIIRGSLLKSVSLVAHPELVRLLGPEESLKDFVGNSASGTLRPESLLIRWFNHHLKRAGSVRVVNNFGKDLQDSECFLILLSQLFYFTNRGDILPEINAIMTKYSSPHILEDRLGRASHVIEFSERLGCKNIFITPVDIAQGHPRLTLSLTATLFNKNIAITLPTEDEIETLQQEKYDLLDQIEDLRLQIQSVNNVAAEKYNSLDSERDLLKGQLSETKARYEAEIKRLTAEFQIYKDELAAQYSDSLESSIAVERRIHQEELWKIMDRQNRIAKSMIAETSNLYRIFSCDSTLAKSDIMRNVLNSFKSLNLISESSAENLNDVDEKRLDSLKMNNPNINAEDWSLLNSQMIELLSKRLRELNDLTKSLKGTVAHKEHVNEVMGMKIREFTEELIKNKAQGNSSNRSERLNSLTRIFSFKK